MQQENYDDILNHGNHTFKWPLLQNIAPISTICSVGVWGKMQMCFYSLQHMNHHWPDFTLIIHLTFLLIVIRPSTTATMHLNNSISIYHSINVLYSIFKLYISKEEKKHNWKFVSLSYSYIVLVRQKERLAILIHCLLNRCPTFYNHMQ